jgi:hypothetical protein
MIRYYRSARAKNGKLIEAIQFAKEVTEYLNKKYSPLLCQVYTATSGDYGTIYWYGDHKDLASVESFQRQLTSDQGYWAIVNKGIGSFIEGSIHDTMMSSL